MYRIDESLYCTPEANITLMLIIPELKNLKIIITWGKKDKNGRKKKPLV